MHWRNSNIQIKYFIAGKCHTADEAYRQLKQLYEDRDIAVKASESSRLRSEAKKLRAESVINNYDQYDTASVLEAKADISEIEAFAEQGKEVLEQGIREKDYIASLMEELEPHRKYNHLPDHEAYQLAQQEEWREELKFRAENYLLTQGTIPHDQLATMRQHPEWNQALLPHIDSIRAELKKGELAKIEYQPSKVLQLMDQSEKASED